MTTWAALYARYGAEYDEPCDTLDEAVDFLARGEWDGTLAAIGVRRPDGSMIPDAEFEELRRAKDPHHHPAWRP